MTCRQVPNRIQLRSLASLEDLHAPAIDLNDKRSSLAADVSVTLRDNPLVASRLEHCRASASHRGVAGPPWTAQPSSPTRQLPKLRLWNESVGQGLGRIGALLWTDIFR